MNTADRHSCWSTLKGGSLENSLYHTRDSVFLATEMNFVWKSELSLIFDQLFCEACTSMFMPSISDIIHLFPWQNYSKKKKYKIEYFLEKCLFKSIDHFFFFLMWTIFKIFVEYCFCFMFWVFFWPPGMWDLSPQSGIEPAPMHWKCRVLIAGPPGKSPFNHFYKESFLLFFPAAVEL